MAYKEINGAQTTDLGPISVTEPTRIRFGTLVFQNDFNAGKDATWKVYVSTGIDDYKYVATIPVFVARTFIESKMTAREMFGLYFQPFTMNVLEAGVSMGVDHAKSNLREFLGLGDTVERSKKKRLESDHSADGRHSRIAKPAPSG